MKILYFDNDSLAIWYKRLEKGRFPKRSEEKPTIERREFFMLLEGIIPKRVSTKCFERRDLRFFVPNFGGKWS